MPVSERNIELIDFIDRQEIKKSPSFLAPLFCTDSEVTLIQVEDLNISEECNVPEKDSKNPSQLTLQGLPTELFVLISMSAGFKACMELRLTCSRFRKILNQRCNWREFTDKSPDVIETKIELDTTLHQFDQILFAKWPMNGQIVPCVIHRTFLSEYDFLGGFSIIAEPTGRAKM